MSERLDVSTSGTELNPEQLDLLQFCESCRNSRPEQPTILCAVEALGDFACLTARQLTCAEIVRSGDKPPIHQIRPT